MIRTAVQSEPLDMSAAHAALAVAGAGGVASFTGLVRADDGVERLELEHYPGVTDAALATLAAEAAGRWPLLSIVVLHRVGVMAPGDAIVFVGTAAPHRAAALAACAFLIDRLKTDAPFWKRETTSEGSRWVEAKTFDDEAADRWRDA